MVGCLTSKAADLIVANAKTITKILHRFELDLADFMGLMKQSFKGLHTCPHCYRN